MNKLIHIFKIFAWCFLITPYSYSDSITTKHSNLGKVEASSLVVEKKSSEARDVIKNSLKLVLPSVKVDSITQTNLLGIYEVVSGRRVFYVDGTGKYAFFGNLVDLQQKRSLTQQKSESLNFIDWNQLPLELGIRHVIGNGERKIAVFTDPECPFCKELEKNTIPKLNNVTIYYYLFPLPMHMNAKSDSEKILCSEVPEKVYLDWMIEDKALPNKSVCEQAKILPLIEQIAQKVISLDATPLIILPNGALVSGLVPPDYLNKLIDDSVEKTLKPKLPKVDAIPVKDSQK